MNARAWSMLVFGAVCTAILVGLGIWQVQRLAWKEALIGQIEAAIAAPPGPLPETVDPSMKYRPVEVAGRSTGQEILVLTGTHESGGGYEVISAFETDAGRRIMVDRGFVPQEARRAPRPEARLRLRGNLHWPAETNSSTPAPNLAEGIWFARDVPAMAAALGTEPVLVVASAVEGDPQGIEPIPVQVTGIPNNHLQYAFTWFMLAAVWAGMTGWAVWTMTRRSS